MKNHILIVEDDEAIREGVRILLEGEGYTVLPKVLLIFGFVVGLLIVVMLG